ncbi:MAG: hypothetical protein COA78_21940 [Blastopirellula sp.]|nr:MAG: hypothetical protein COA78_21940 [Blastopirellula sp.]
MKLPLPISSNQARSKISSVEQLLNCYIESTGDRGKSPTVIYGVSGLTGFSNIPTAINRGIHYDSSFDADNYYSVVSNSLYKINSSGVETLLTTIDGSGSVNFSTNLGQLIICTRDATTNNYVWDGTSAVNILQEANSSSFINQRTIYYTDKKIYYSDLGDAATVGGLSFFSAEGSTDKTRWGITDRLELWIFGETTIEVWRNVTDPDNPFERIGGVFIERGILSPYTVSQVDNGVFWVGDDGVVYRPSSYTPSRISTHPVERDINNLVDKESLESLSYTEDGHPFYVLTCPEFTWVYDASTQQWHERQSYTRNNWIGKYYTRAFDKHLIAGDGNGKTYELSQDIFDEDGDYLIKKFVTPHVNAFPDSLSISRMSLDIETGFGGECMVRHSKDGGYTWSAVRHKTLGDVGKYYTRYVENRFGESNTHGAVFELSMSDSVQFAITLQDADGERKTN